LTLRGLGYPDRLIGVHNPATYKIQAGDVAVDNLAIQHTSLLQIIFELQSFMATITNSGLIVH
jgi:hypothetical protein